MKGCLDKGRRSKQFIILVSVQLQDDGLPMHKTNTSKKDASLELAVENSGCFYRGAVLLRAEQ